MEISPLRQDTLLDGTLDQCQQLRIKPMAGPAGGGQLFSAERFSPLRAELRAIAEETGAASIEQVVYAR